MGEKDQCTRQMLMDCLLHIPNRGHGLQPGDVPWPGIEQVTVWSKGQLVINPLSCTSQGWPPLFFRVSHVISMYSQPSKLFLKIATKYFYFEGPCCFSCNHSSLPLKQKNHHRQYVMNGCGYVTINLYLQTTESGWLSLWALAFNPVIRGSVIL